MSLVRIVFFFILIALTRASAAKEAVQAAASLLCFVEQSIETLDSGTNPDIAFSQDDLENLWNQLPEAELAQQAVAASHTENSSAEKRSLLQQASLSLTTLWQKLKNDSSEAKTLEFQQFSASLEDRQTIPSKMRKRFTPYLLPTSHLLKPALDAIFKSQRATANDQALRQAGFHILFAKSRSFIRVVRHPSLPGHLVKLNVDNEHRKKRGLPAWEWLAKRCQGAIQVRRVIQSKKISRFQVPQKWLYILPENPPPSPNDIHQPVILLVEDMQLVPWQTNLDFWKSKVTHAHLNELYIIISHARGSSYRPDNIWLSKNGKVSFVDTEYPGMHPDFRRIRYYLNNQSLAYWDKLIREGGP